jgi:hypothetical protein
MLVQFADPIMVADNQPVRRVTRRPPLPVGPPNTPAI